MNEFVGKVVPGQVSKIREFAIQPGIERHAMVDIVPPPFFTAMTPVRKGVVFSRLLRAAECETSRRGLVVGSLSLVRLGRLAMDESMEWMARYPECVSVSRPQIRGARAMLGWSIVDLARATGLSVATVTRAEEGALQQASALTSGAIIASLEAAGIRFLPDDGDGAGLRLGKLRTEAPEG